jgi:filamentous hemagglutinin
MLQRLAVDPATAQKRLGDGFYEQKLIREQVAQLTGRRFLDGYADDEAQYIALIDSAVTLAEAWQLVPGVALSAEQMAQLTSDIVWLVEREVTLADGTTALALVPQVYVRVREGDLDGHGALLAGQTLNLDVSGDLLNSGSLGARGVAAITAENLNNLGGRIQGNSVDLHARNDLNNLGGQIRADDSLNVTAGRDLNLIANTLSSTSEQGSRQMVSRIAGLFVSEPAGKLLAAAGRDLRMQAAQISNSGAEGQTLLAAGRDLDIGTVQESHTQAITWDSANWRKEASSREVGSSIQAQGDLHLQAGNDLNLRASSVSAEGALLASAGRDIQLSAGSQTRDVDEAHKSVGRSGISAKTTTSRDSFSDDQALTSTLAGGQTVLQAGRDIGSEGAYLSGSDELLLVAGRDINLLAATSSGQQASSKSRKSLTSSDGRSSQSTWQSPEGSQLQGGDVELFAGQDIQLQGSALRAEGAALLSAGRDIDIGSAVHSQSQSSSSHSNRVGFAHHGFLTQEQKAQQGRQTQHEAVGSLLSADRRQPVGGRRQYRHRRRPRPARYQQ